MNGSAAAVRSAGCRNHDYRREELAHEPKRLGVLIDAENVPAKVIGRVFNDLVRFGEPIVRRAYGPFHGPLGGHWEEVLARHAIVPQHQPRHGRGRNATDIALVIDAVDLLHNGDLDGMVLVSGDSDLTALAIRVREQHLHCYGYGKHDTPERLRNACTRFVYLENLKFDPLSAATNPALEPLRPKTEALAIIKPVVAELATPGEWVDLDVLERELERRINDFDPRTFGYVRLVDLLVALKPLVVDQSRRSTTRARLRIKKSKKPVTVNSSSANSARGRSAIHETASSVRDVQIVASEQILEVMPAPASPPGGEPERDR